MASASKKPVLVTIEWASKVRLKPYDWQLYLERGIKSYHMTKQEKIVAKLEFQFLGWGYCNKRRKPFFVYIKGKKNEEMEN